MPPAPRRVPVRGLRRRRLPRSSTSRSSRTKAFLRTRHDRPGLARSGRSSTSARRSRRRSPHRRPWLVDPTRKHKPENCEQDRSTRSIRLHLRHGPFELGLVIIAGRVGFWTAIRSNNFVEADVLLQPERPPRTGPSRVTIVGPYAYVSLSDGTGGHRHQRSQEADACRRWWAKRCLQAREGGPGPVPLRLRLRRGWREGARRHRAGSAEAGLCRSDAGSEQHLYRPQLRLRCGGCAGLVILDVTNPESPQPYLQYNAGGCINDTHDVKLGVYYASQFASPGGRGKNGVWVIQLTSPETPGCDGFPPWPVPMLIGTYVDPEGWGALAGCRRVWTATGRPMSAGIRSRSSAVSGPVRRIWKSSGGSIRTGRPHAVQGSGCGSRLRDQWSASAARSICTGSWRQHYGESLHPTFMRQ